MASTTSASVPSASAFPDGTTEYTPLRKNTTCDPKKPHITELPMTLKNWYKHIDWLNVTFILFIPALGL